MSRESDIEWERVTLARARKAAAELIDAAVELRWYTDDPAEAALGHVEAVLRERGQLTAEPPASTSLKRKKKLPFRAVWDRDDWTCKHCGSHRDLTVDHIIALVNGGTDEMDNYQTLCGSCNSRKGARS